MSLQINDTATYRGIAQMYERELGYERGFITSNTDRYKEFIADVNLSLDDYIAMAIQTSGTWQFDDSNHSKFPEIKTGLVSGQRDYTFTTDGEGALILDIYRVYAADEGGTYRELQPKDQQSHDDTYSFYDGNDTKGVPQWYDKTANGIFVDPIPDYNETNGLKVWINREANYFTTSDTTKKPGVPGVHHKYFVIASAAEEARRQGLTVASSLANQKLLWEQSIRDYFGQRQKDKEKVLKDKSIKYRQYM